MDLTLSEKLTLIALDDEGGYFVDMGMSMYLGLAGAALMELAAMKKVDVQDSHVQLRDKTPVNNPILDEVIALLANSKKPRKLNHWIETLSQKSEKWKPYLLKSLIQKRILVEKRKRFLGIISYKRYPMVNPSYENEIKARLQRVVLQNTTPKEDELMLIGLIHSCQLEGELFKDRHQRKEARKKMEELSAHNQYSKVIDETQAAITAAIVASLAATMVVTTVVTTT